MKRLSIGRTYYTAVRLSITTLREYRSCPYSGQFGHPRYPRGLGCFVWSILEWPFVFDLSSLPSFVWSILEIVIFFRP